MSNEIYEPEILTDGQFEDKLIELTQLLKNTEHFNRSSPLSQVIATRDKAEEIALQLRRTINFFII